MGEQIRLCAYRTRALASATPAVSAPLQLPDTLVLVFAANDQSFNGGMQVVAAAQKARHSYGHDRGQLTVVPLLSRWCGDAEVDIADEWMRRFDSELASVVGAWLPKEFTPRQLLERLRVPHVARFSFGEPLPVLTHSLTDPTLPGLRSLHWLGFWCRICERPGASSTRTINRRCFGRG